MYGQVAALYQEPAAARAGRHASQGTEVAIAKAKLTDGGRKRLDSFYKVNRKGKEFWVLALVTERLKWGQETRL